MWSLVFVLLTLLSTLQAAPTDIVISSAAYTPLSIIGQNVGIITVVDPIFSGHQITLTGGAHASYFQVVSGYLRFTQAGVGATNLEVEITATDGSQNTFSKIFIITYNNVAPVAIGVSPSTYSPPSTVGMAVGTLSATDYNEGQTFTYQVTGGADQSLFAVVNGNLEFVVPSIGRTGLQVEITVDDGNSGTFAQNLTINYENVAPTGVVLSTYLYPPASVAGATAATLTATDANDGQAHSFAIVSQDPSSPFLIAGNALQWARSGVNNNTLVVEIEATDAGGLKFTEPVTVFASNVAPTQVVGPCTYYPPSLASDPVCSLTVVDANENDVHTLVISGGANQGLFQLTGNSLSWNTSGIGDDNLVVDITATDAGGLSVVQTVTVNYLNVQPTAITSTTYTPPSSGTTFVTLSVVDANNGQSHTLTLLDPPGSSVLVGADQVNLLGGPFGSNLTINVQAVNGDGDNFTYAVAVNTVNLAPTAVVSSASTYAPRSITGAVVSTLSATDANTDDTHVFTLSPTYNHSLFTIVGNQLQFALDGIGADNLQVEVTADDRRGGLFTQILTFNTIPAAPTDIVAANDPPWRTTGDHGSPYYTPRSVVNDEIMTLTAVDPNDADTTHTFTVVGGVDAADVTIVGSSLRFLTAGIGRSHLYVTITATDAGGLQYTKDFTIRALNTAPDTLIFNGDTTFIPPIPYNFALGTFASTDPNDNDRKEYTVVGGPDADKFYISGNVLFIRKNVRETPLSIDVRVRDWTRNFLVQTFTFTALNQNPTVVQLDSNVYEAPGTAGIVGGLSTLDPNGNETHVFSITGGAQAAAFDIIDIDGVPHLTLSGNLGTLSGTQEVQITVNDCCGGSLTETFSIYSGLCGPDEDFFRGSCYRNGTSAMTYAAAAAECANVYSYAGGAALATVDVRQGTDIVPADHWVSSCEGQGALCAYHIGTGCNSTDCSLTKPFVCQSPAGRMIENYVVTPDPTGVDMGETETALLKGSNIYLYGSAVNSEMYIDRYQISVTHLQAPSGAVFGLYYQLGSRSNLGPWQMLAYSSTKGLFLAAAATNNATAGTYVEVPLMSSAPTPRRMHVTKEYDNSLTAHVEFADGTADFYQHIAVNDLPYAHLWNTTTNLTDSWLRNTTVAGISSSNLGATGFWEVTGLDISSGAVSVSSTTPARGSIGVAPGTVAVQVQFDREVSLGVLSAIQVTEVGGPSFDCTTSGAVCVASGDTLSITPPSTFTYAASKTYTVSLRAFAVRDVRSRDYFNGYESSFATSPTAAGDIASSPNMTVALNLQVENFQTSSFCAAIGATRVRISCSQVQILDVHSGSTVVVFQFVDVAAASLEAILLDMQQVVADGTLSAALVSQGQGGIIYGTFTVDSATAETISYLSAVLNPDIPDAPTTATITVQTTVGGLPQDGEVYLTVPTDFQVGAASDIYIVMSVANSQLPAQTYMASAVSGQTIQFNTSWDADVSQGNVVTFAVSGIRMPIHCYNLNNWLWGVQFYSPDGNLFNYGVVNSPVDTCNGQSSTDVNDAPVLSFLQGWFSTMEDTKVLVPHPVTITDDAWEAGVFARMTVTLSLEQNGSKIKLWPAQYSWEQADILNGTDDSSYIKFAGSPLAVTYALANMEYTPAPDFCGTENLTVTVDDGGYCCNMDPKTDTLEIPIYVVCVNDAPTIAITQGSASNTIVEDYNITLGFTVSDLDASGTDTFTFTLAGTPGTFELAQTTGLTDIPLVPPSTYATRMTGALDDVNAALASILYSPDMHYVGLNTLTLTVEDNGNGPLDPNMEPLTTYGHSYPASTSLSATQVINVIHTGVNDVPNITLIGGQVQTTNEDVTLPLMFEIYDPDELSSASPGVVTMNFTLLYGDIQVPTGSGMTVSMSEVVDVNFTIVNFTTNATTNETTVYKRFTVEGTIAEMRTHGFLYVPVTNWFGVEFIDMVFADNIMDGVVGMQLFAYENVTITVNSVNDAPAVTYGGSVPVTFHRDVWQPLTVMIDDVDAFEGDITVTVSALRGILRLNYTSMTGSSLTMTGNVSWIQTAIADLEYHNSEAHRQAIYHITDNQHGTDTVTIVVVDNGNTGANGVQSTTLTVPMVITATLWPTCQAYLDAHSSVTGVCGCYYKSASAGNREWTKVPTNFDSAMLLQTVYPRRFMSGCCADIDPVTRNVQLDRVGELGICINANTI